MNETPVVKQLPVYIYIYIKVYYLKAREPSEWSMAFFG